MLTYILSCTISKLLQIIDPILAFDSFRFLFSALISCELLKCTTMIFGVRRLEMMLYLHCEMYLDILSHVGINQECGRRMDGQNSLQQ